MPSHIYRETGLVLTFLYFKVHCLDSVQHGYSLVPTDVRGGRGRDHMVVGVTTTYAISAYHHCCCELESRSGRGVQHVIKFVSDLRQVVFFLRVLRLPTPIKLTATI